jgi:hypothetical protein
MHRRSVVRPPQRMSASLALSLRNAYETLAISAPTVLDALRGRVTKQACDERLDRWSRACLRNADVQLNVGGREHLAPGETYLFMTSRCSFRSSAPTCV